MADKKDIQIFCMADADTPEYKDFEELLKVVKGTLLDFYTMDLEELGFIAKHRLLPVPTILILNGTKVIGRIVRPPKMEQVLNIINTITGE
jgi:hypothetical protein